MGAARNWTRTELGFGVSGSWYECRDRTWWGFPVEGNTIALEVIVRIMDRFKELEGRLRRRQCMAVEGPKRGGRSQIPRNLKDPGTGKTIPL
jgi:hypothetical protein